MLRVLCAVNGAGWATPCADQVLGLYPARAPRVPVSQAVASSTAESAAPLALWVQWKQRAAAGLPRGIADPAQGAREIGIRGAAAGSTCSEAVQEVSVRLGRVWAAWVPGLAGRIVHAASRWMLPAPTAADAAQQPATPLLYGSSSHTHAAATETSEQRLWLLGAWENALSIDSLQLAALATEEPGAEAVLLSVSKLSGRLGPVKPAATAAGPAAGEGARTSVTAELMWLVGSSAPHFGARWAASFLAWLFDLAQSCTHCWKMGNLFVADDTLRNLPTSYLLKESARGPMMCVGLRANAHISHGRRLAILGMEVSVAERWLPAASRESVGASTTGARSVSNGTEAQLLLWQFGARSQRSSPDPPSAGSSAAEARGTHVCAATSQLVASLNAAEVAAVLAVCGGITASVSAGFFTLLEPRIALSPGNSLFCILKSCLRFPFEARVT